MGDSSGRGMVEPDDHEGLSQPNLNNSMIEVQCCAWVRAVTSANHNYTVPSVLMHANGLMIPEAGEVFCFFL